MNPSGFANHLRGIIDEVSASEAEVLAKPTGRSPYKSDVERSIWFLGLDEVGQEMAVSLLRRGAFAALFDACCELDAVRAIDDHGGSLRLTYADSAGTETLLNDLDALELHGEFRGDGPLP